MCGDTSPTVHGRKSTLTLRTQHSSAVQVQAFHNLVAALRVLHGSVARVARDGPNDSTNVTYLWIQINQLDLIQVPCPGLRDTTP